MIDTHAPVVCHQDKLFRATLDMFLALSFLFVSFRVLRDITFGGNPWKQGDWLINNMNADVRRGHLGTVIINFSDTTGLDLLMTVAILQIITLLVLHVSFRFLLHGIQHPMVAPLLAISPAIFAVFWIADPQASVRKELLAFAGLSVCALAMTKKHRLCFWAGVSLLCISFLAHEAMILFLPAFFILLMLSRTNHQNRTDTIACSMIALAFASYSLFYSLTYRQVHDTHLICQPLLERGLDESICGGAISWLAYDSAYGFQQVLSLVRLESLAGFMISYALAMWPSIYILTRTRRSIAAITIFLLLALPFLPLYVVAIDWGRWMSFHIFSSTILIATTIASQKLHIEKSFSSTKFVAMMIISLLISPNHTIGIHKGGVFRTLAPYVWRLIN